MILLLLAPTATAQPPPKDDAPLTAREQQMMDLIRSLQERVARLEAQAGANARGTAAPGPAPAALNGEPATVEIPVASTKATLPPATGTATIAKTSEQPAELAAAPSPVAAPASASEPPSKTQEQPTEWGTYTPNLGFKLAETEHGDLNVSIYTYVRYLNQLGLAPTYTDAFGNTKSVQQRQDFQFQKVQIKFLGWLMNPKFRYFIYAWTSNASQGQGAQVVLAGNLNYEFSKYLTLSGGITSLPGTRSVEGNFPFWLAVDSRLIADEFFRGSYTSGIWARGQITKRLRYQAMLGNNLSTLGVSAAQLPNYLKTFSSALVWTPTGGEFGVGFGDYEDHERPATRLAAHFSRSDENKQSQPNSEGIENTQLRLSDGSVIFTPDLFGKGISITDATYKMTAFDAGVKYQGFSLDGTYFMRWLDHFRGSNTAGLTALFDHGFQSEISKMVVPRTFQVYGGGSKIFGQYGKPWDLRSGINWFPWKNRVVRWNGELLYLSRSPVGYTSVPFALGGKGLVFHTSFEMAF